MNIKSRLLRLEKKNTKCSEAEFVFKGVNETEDEAYSRGKLQYPNADLIIISWVSPPKPTSKN